MKATNQKTEPTAKKEAYMSMDREERDVLRTLGLRERALYPELKWLASFKSGQVEHFGKRVITYQFLADLITVPTTQGRAADTMNAKESCRVLMKLYEAGLVGDIYNDPVKGLRFVLPMSPICKVTARKLRQIAQAEEQVMAAKLPNDAPVNLSGNSITTGLSVESDPSLSVMTISKGDQYIFHTDISNIAAVHGTAAARDIVAATSLRAQMKTEAEAEADATRGATANALSVETIKGRLRASKSEFGWIDQDESNTMYRRWVAQGHSAAKFEDAVKAVEDDFNVEPSPRAVDNELRSGTSNREGKLRAEQRAKRKRGVAL